MLKETLRVLRAGGLMAAGCLGVADVPRFAREEFGFYLRDAPTLKQLCFESGFSGCEAQDLSIELPSENGKPGRLSVVSLLARR